MYYIAYRDTPCNNPILIIRSLYTAKCILVSQEINFNDLWGFWENFNKYESNIRLFTGFVFTSSMKKLQERIFFKPFDKDWKKKLLKDKKYMY